VLVHVARRNLIRAGALLICGGCQGAIEQPLGPNRLDWPGGESTDSVSEGPCEPRLPARLLLLSDYQHVSALRAVMGADAIAVDDAPNRALKPFGQKGLVVSTSLFHTRSAWAEQAVVALKNDPLKATGCSTVDAACAERFLRKRVPRAFRRPVSDEEISDLMEVYAVGAQTSAVNGLARALEAALASPSFMFRRELGADEETEDGSQLTLDAYELASALSFALSDSPPDDDLWQAAETGALLKADELTRQITRLLLTPAVQEGLTSTLLSAWGLGNIFGSVKDPALFPEFTPQMQASMYHETELLVGDVLWQRKAPLNELMSTRESFVDRDLAQLYGLASKPAVDEFVSVMLPEQRAGLLTQASVMSMLARSDTTSVVARGIFVRGMLCMSKVGAPPENLSGDITALLAEDMTERERAEVRANNPKCAACHAGIDPFGLLLENYDPLGRYRTTLAGKPIDSAVDVPGSTGYAGHHEDAISLLDSVAMGDEFTTCVATRLLGYATRDDALTPRDCQIKEALEGSEVSALTITEVVQRALSSKALRARRHEESL
jgi:hypothetical protein